MKDVAERAGVSVTTVSHVINNSRPVSEELTKRVHDAMEELDYQPNLLARSLRMKKTKTIGVILPDISNSFFADVARAIEDSSFTHDFSVIFCNTDGDMAKEIIYTRALSEKQVDGIIFVASGDSAELVRSLQAQRMPVVIVDRPLGEINADTVISNNAPGAFQAVQHLVQLGHRRIACITGPSVLETSTQRLFGYRKAMQEAGLPIQENMIARSNFRFEGGRDAAIKLLTLPDPPTAIFAFNDLMAIGAIGAAKSLGMMIPDDLSIVGFDDILISSYFNPALTTVVQPKYDLGVLATTMLLERIENPRLPKRRELLPTNLIVRATTAAPPASRSFLPE